MVIAASSYLSFLFNHFLSLAGIVPTSQSMWYYSLWWLHGWRVASTIGRTFYIDVAIALITLDSEPVKSKIGMLPPSRVTPCARNHVRIGELFNCLVSARNLFATLMNPGPFLQAALVSLPSLGLTPLEAMANSGAIDAMLVSQIYQAPLPGQRADFQTINVWYN